MLDARHTPRLARCPLAVDRVFGESLRYQRGESSEMDRRSGGRDTNQLATLSGAVRIPLPA